ncbi:hypothetical protein HZC21_06080 [Candidatus Peregrinibacteria bacterium]|nr:hypothetical protein [Candidatus Peregrinibacteria bacterium]
MYHRIPLSVEVRRVLKLLTYTLTALLLISSVYYFIKSSNTAEEGYKLKENQLIQRKLETENKILKQNVLDAQSLNEVQQSSVVGKMEQPEKQIFVEPKGPLGKRK